MSTDWTVISTLSPWEKYCLTGGGKGVFVFYVAGMPWAVSTHEINASLTTAQRYELFGARPNGDATYPAASVHVAPWLTSIGDVTTSVVEEESKISGGSLRVRIADNNPGISWPHNLTGRTIWGLDGLNTTPSPNNDSLVYSGRLALTISSSATSISVTQDAGDRLQDLVTATAPAYVYVWLGSEVIALTGITVAGDTTFTASCTRGHYRTRAQSHVVDSEYDAVPVRLCTAPLGGIARRPAYLFWFDVDSSGAPTGSPATVWHGRVGTRIEYVDGQFGVSCDPWWSYLDTDFPVKLPIGYLRGYFFQRSDTLDATDFPIQRAHIEIWEYTDLAPDPLMIRKNIWLCAEDSHVYYETYAQLCEAVQAELDLCRSGASVNGSDALDFQYRLDTDKGIYHVDDSELYATGSGNYYYSVISGSLPWLCGWNPTDAKLFADTEQFFTSYKKGKYVFNLRKAENILDETGESPATDWQSALPEWRFKYCYNQSRDLSKYNAASVMWMPTEDYVGEIFRSRYAYSWDYSVALTHATEADWIDKLAEVHFFAFPGYNQNLVGAADDQQSLYIGWSQDAAKWEATQTLTIGTSSSTVFFAGKPNLSRFVVESVDSVNNAIKPDTTGDIPGINGYNDWEFSVAVLAPELNDADVSGPWYDGCWLYRFNRYSHIKYDPFRITSRATYRTTSPSKIWRGLLGDGVSGFAFPTGVVMDHISDGVDHYNTVDMVDYYDQRASIDWDSLDDAWSRVTDGEYYRLDVGEKFNFAEALTTELKLHGIVPYIEWSNDSNQYMVRFRRIAQYSTGDALSAGRDIDVSTRSLYSMTSGEHHGAALYSAIKAKWQYSNGDDEYRFSVVAKSQTGYELLGRHDRALSIESKITRIENFDHENTDLAISAATYLGQLLEANARETPTIQCDTTLHSAILHTPGVVVSVTDSYARNPETGEIGLSDVPAVVTKLKHKIQTGECSVTLRSIGSATSTLNARSGWSPSLFVAAANAVYASDDSMTLTPATHQYSTAPSGVDLYRFDCLSYNTSLQKYASRSCACTDYNVYVWEYADTGWTLLENAATISVTAPVDGAAPTTAVVTATDLGLTWDTGVDHVITYADSSGTLQSCQRRYVVLTKIDGTITVSGTDYPGNEWQ